MDWISTQDLQLIYELKQQSTFHSSHWQHGYNPDLTFVSKDQSGNTLIVTREVLLAFPNSHHRPIMIYVGIEIPVFFLKPVPQWNFAKADWDAYKQTIEKTVARIPARPECYQQFTGLLKVAGKKNVSRDFRK
ncbi:unnamed protein product [Caretta caretta]